MTFLDAPVLFMAAVVAGGMNAVAGGGSFVSFPALVFSGVPAITANATSTVALWPGTIASTLAYRAELRTMKTRFLPLAGISLAGGLLGALLLLHTSDSAFRQLVPWLLLIATAVFAAGPSVTVRLRRSVAEIDPASLTAKELSWGAVLVQFIIAIYGGYFGGGIGIMMLAALAIGGMTDLHDMNALKNGLAMVINGIAVLTFILAGAVAWPEMFVMVLGSIVGGYGGVGIARRVPPPVLRRFVIFIGAVLTIYFFLRR